MDTRKTRQENDQPKGQHIWFSHFPVFPDYGTVILNHNISLFHIYNDTKKARPVSPRIALSASLTAIQAKSSGEMSLR